MQIMQEVDIKIDGIQLKLTDEFIIASSIVGGEEKVEKTCALLLLYKVAASTTAIGSVVVIRVK